MVFHSRDSFFVHFFVESSLSEGTSLSVSSISLRKGVMVSLLGTVLQRDITNELLCYYQSYGGELCIRGLDDEHDR